MIERARFILYVADQDASTAFWSRVLDTRPALDVPGMTEFTLSEGVVLGLMPERGIVRLLGPAVGDPSAGSGVARAELYLVVADPEALHRRAVAAGARELSGYARRDWGHGVAYSMDPDGYVLAFACATPDAP